MICNLKCISCVCKSNGKDGICLIQSSFTAHIFVCYGLRIICDYYRGLSASYSILAVPMVLWSASSLSSQTQWKCRILKHHPLLISILGSNDAQRRCALPILRKPTLRVRTRHLSKASPGDTGRRRTRTPSSRIDECLPHPRSAAGHQHWGT